MQISGNLKYGKNDYNKKFCKAGIMAQVVERLPSKHKALNSNPSTA
jgi:hypothetical protein